MKTDRYTKAILTIIAACLAFIALGRSVTPTPVQAAPPAAGTYDNVVVTGIGLGIVMFDKKTGQIWIYGGEDFKTQANGVIEKPGTPVKWAK